MVVTYSGDANNNGVASANGDEPVVVAPANLLNRTSPNPSDVTLSNDPLPPVATDSATLSGSYHATGTITFDLYGPDGVTILYTDTQPVNGDGTYITTFAEPAPPPGYPITGPTIGSSPTAATPTTTPWPAIGNESVQIHPANPSLGTDTIPPQVTLSNASPPILTDTATLSGGFQETGTLTFDLYAPGGDVPVDAESVTVNGDGSYTTPTGYTLPTTGTLTGTYQWVVTYSGDANNNGVASANGDEPVVVAPANLLMRTSPTRRT